MGRSKKNTKKAINLKTSNHIKQETTVSKPIKSIDLKNNIDKFMEYSEKYAPEKVKLLENILQNLNNQEYKIAVVANMSAGKSTFINALFGKEVLPAFNHATTDCATYIYSEPDIEKKAIIYFNDNKEHIEIKNDLEREITQYAQKDEECEDDKYKNVEMIELLYPFKNLQTKSSDDFKIIFIDTPGPNSTGEGYKQKHKDQTRKVLNDVDLALFIFDYTQLDANLESDEQGLWNTIKKRHEKDSNFDVYFIVNKIDYALDDNFKGIDKGIDREEFIKQKKERWNTHENLAIKKLQDAAKSHNISNPKIYPVSSKFQLLSRDKYINWDLQDELDAFKKSHFKRLYDEAWEDKFIEYLGIAKLEKDINEYINSSVKDKIVKKLDSNFFNIWYDEKNTLEMRIRTLEKPKEEAEQNLNKAIIFLKGKADGMEAEFKEKSHNIQRSYTDSIKTIVNNNIEKELKKNIKEATNRTIKFLELLLEGSSEIDATSDAKNLPKEQIKDHLDKKNIKISVEQEFEVKLIEKKLQNFIKSILNDYKNNYLDMKIDIKNNYQKLSESISNLFNNYKREFDKELKNTLKIENIDLDEGSLYNESIFDDDIKVPDSTIDYKHQAEKWDEGGSFTGRKKIQNEKHSIIISPSNIEKIFELSIDSMKRTYYNKEIKTYEDTIKEFIKLYQGKFNDFKEAKKKEIEQIEKDLENSKENLEMIETQYNKLQSIQKEL